VKQIKEITSDKNTIYKTLKTLSQKKVREANRLFLIEGLRLFQEALSRGVGLKYLIIDEARKEVPNTPQGCQIFRLKDHLFKKISDTVNPQGIIAVAEKTEMFLKDIELNAMPFIVVLDRIQDPGNLGTIIRTCAAAGITALLLVNGTVDLYNPKVIRSTMGALFQVPIVERLKDSEAIKWLQEHSIEIMVADLDGEEYYYSIDLRKPLAIVIGNENKGLSSIWKKAARKKVKIPIPGLTESLNASVAAGIILYDVVRQRSCD